MNSPFQMTINQSEGSASVMSNHTDILSEEKGFILCDQELVLGSN